MIRFAFDVILFEKCNMKCRHCYQHNGDSFIDWNKINNIPSLIENAIRQRKEPFDVITIGINGGELFIDSFGDDYFVKYYQLIENIKLIVSKFNVPCSIELVSNGIFTKRDRVQNLLQQTNSKISISYDPVNRYQSARQKQLALHNIKYFNDIGLLDEISLTLTAPTIDYIVINDDLKQFGGIPIGICYYVLATKGNNDLIASDHQLYQFFKYCHVHRYKNVRAYRDLIESIRAQKSFKFCNCDNRIVIRNGHCHYSCSVYATDYQPIDFFGTNNINPQTISIVRNSKSQIKRGCLDCSYIDICPGICAMSILHKEISISSQCFLKRLIRELQENKVS